MADPSGKPPTVVELIWEHDLVLGGRSGKAHLTLDSAGDAGPSPMQALGVRARRLHGDGPRPHPAKGPASTHGLKADLRAERAPEVPHRFTAVDAALHGHRRRPGGTGPARDRSLPREVLLGVALDAPGHRARRHLHGRRPRSDRRAPMTERPAGRHACRRPRPAAAISIGCAGIAVLIMIEAHVVDSWTASPDRSTRLFAWAMVLGGFGAPLFLLLAGVAVSLSAGSKRTAARRRAGGRLGGDAARARDLPARVPLPASGVDPGLVVAADAAAGGHPQHHGPGDHGRRRAVGPVPTSRGRVAAFLAATLATTLPDASRQASTWLGRLPDPIEAYIRPAGA